MSNKMNVDDFVNNAITIAKEYKTLYVSGCFGAPLIGVNVQRYTTNHSYNRRSDRKAMIIAASEDPVTYGFDCVNLIKGILWGWNGSSTSVYGGAVYTSNGLPDINEDTMISMCDDISTNFDNIIIGEVVYNPGHIGIYIGDGLVVECTPSFTNNVQFTRLGNISASGGNIGTRIWSKHGKLPWVNYDSINTTINTPEKAIEFLSTYSSLSSNDYWLDSLKYYKNIQYVLMEWAADVQSFINKTRIITNAEENIFDLNTPEGAINYLNQYSTLSNVKYWMDALNYVYNIEYVFMKWAQDVESLSK